MLGLHPSLIGRSELARGSKKRDKKKSAAIESEAVPLSKERAKESKRERVDHMVQIDSRGDFVSMEGTRTCLPMFATSLSV